MTPRLNPFTASPAAMQPWIDLGKTIQDDGLEPLLKELVMMRTSQINGCAFCIHYHTSDARRHGETAERLYLLSAWRESTLYSERERAALGWTEALTLVSETRAPDDAYEAPAPALQRGGAGEAHLADRARQRLEPDQYRLSFRPPGRSEERGLMGAASRRRDPNHIFKRSLEE